MYNVNVRCETQLNVDKNERAARMTNSTDILSIDEVADLFSVHVVTARKLAAEGRIPGRKVGREWRFSRRALIEWLESGEETNEERAKTCCDNQVRESGKSTSLSALVASSVAQARRTKKPRKNFTTE